VCRAQEISSRVLRRQAGQSVPDSQCAFRPDPIGVSRPRNWHRITAGHDSRGDNVEAPSNRFPHRQTAPYPHSARVLGGCPPPPLPPDPHIVAPLIHWARALSSLIEVGTFGFEEQHRA